MLIHQITSPTYPNYVSYLTKFSSLLQFPRDEDGEPIFDELICKSCVPLCSFLSKYPDFVITPSAVPDESTDPVENVEAGNIVATFIVNCRMFRAKLLTARLQLFLFTNSSTVHHESGL